MPERATETRHPSLRQSMAHADSAAAIAEILLRERERICSQNQAHPQGVRTCRALSDATDCALQRLFHLALADTADREHVRARIAVAATGGYGRRELCPFSDVDVTFIVADEEDQAVEAAVRRMFLGLMELFSQRLQLKVGYGYRTIADIEGLEHQTQAALLDARLITGSHPVFDQYTRALVRSIWPAGFVRHKIGERQEQWRKHGGTVYQIEPQVREGAGGLRDLHLAEWLAAVTFPFSRGDVWRQLQRQGVISRPNGQQVGAAREFLLTVRNWMHFRTGRPADILVRERQELLAETLGFHDDGGASAVERFMERYYEHAEHVRRVAGYVVDRCRRERLALSDELVCVDDELAPAYPWINVATPAFLIQVAEQHQAHAVRPGPDLQRMIAEHLPACPPLLTDPDAAQAFVGLLRAPSGVYETLELLASLGALQRLLPDLAQAYRRVPFDPIHRHTIGYHSLQAVRSLEAVRESSDPATADVRRVWSEIECPELLFLATLLHDIGKIKGGGGHSETGASLAREMALQMGVHEAGAQKVETLIRHHLLMSETSQLQDMTLPQTIRTFVEAVGSLDVLKMLLLLTYADMEATGVLSAVKTRFLTDLYFRAEGEFSSATPVAMDDARVRRYRQRLSRQLSGVNLTAEQIQQYTEGMPVTYLLNTRPEQIAVHIRMTESLNGAPAVVEFEADSGTEISVLTVCTYEAPQPGLFNRIAGVLYAHEVGIHGAQVFTRKTSPAIALDTLWVDYHDRPLPVFKKLEVEQDLLTVLGGEPVEQLLARSRKQLPPGVAPERVTFNNELAEHYTVLRVDAPDQPGLLYRVTRAIASLGWNIHSARVSTIGDRARDAFYLTTSEGEKLLEDESQLQQAFVEAYFRA